MLCDIDPNNVTAILNKVLGELEELKKPGKVCQYNDIKNNHSHSV